MERDHYQEIGDLSTTDGVLRYVDRMLMEDEMDDEANRILDSSNFQAKERSFYELIGQEYPQQEPPADRVIRDPLCESEVVSWNFWKGVDEASKFLPSNSLQGTIGNDEDVSVKESDNHDTYDIKINGGVITRGKSNKPHPDDELDTWTYNDGGCEKFAAHITDFRNASKVHQQQRKNKKEEVDTRSLLISCAQSVASDDQPKAIEFLRQIKRHSNQFGDVEHRVAHYLVRGLEARLDGTGGSMQKAFVYETMSASDYLIAYSTSLISSSFRRISIFASNKLIVASSKKSARVHIIDFGILYGFQWPPLIQRLSEREGGPPKLRITGIDFPQPGCEPAERIKATGERLVYYAEMFGVPFEYNSIAQSWGSIRVEDLNIEEGEYVAVNCLYRSENLMPDEMLVTESPRSKFLELVRKMNPDMFVNAVVHGGYGVPYFVTRFREAMFTYSALFDMVETIVPAGRPERMLLESILGNEVINVVACEGWERVVRPESSTQWRLRHSRAGLEQVALGKRLLDAIVNKVRSCYHREFVVDEDRKFLMMSWKGKTICGLSCWRPSSKRLLTK